MTSPGNAEGTRMLLRSTQPITRRDMTAMRGGAIYGGTAIPLSAVVPVCTAPAPEHPTQIESPTYRPRPVWAAWQRGYMVGMLAVLLTWVAVALVMEVLR